MIYTPGGSTYDMYARFLMQYMGKHLPGNPTFVPRNMPGAGGIAATQFLNRIAPKDGTVFGTIARNLPFEPLLGKAEADFDPLAFVWLGSMNRERSIALSWHTSKVKTLADLQQMELLVPGTGAGADSEVMPLAFNALFGTKFKIVRGYKSTSDATLAVERGELDGIAYWSWSAIQSSHKHWLDEKKVNVLFHTGPDPDPGNHGAVDPQAGAQRHRARRARLHPGARNSRPPVPRAARNSGGPREGAQGGLQRHHEGPRLPRRSQEAQYRGRACHRRGSDGRVEEGGRVAAGGDRAGEESSRALKQKAR